jgi:hypothetical protein
LVQISIGDLVVSRPRAMATSQLFRRKYRTVKTASGRKSVSNGATLWEYGGLPVIRKKTVPETQIAIAGAAVLKRTRWTKRPLGLIQN